ncbi:zinc ribbon domain-containing protein [Nocardia sp. NPDC056611]|uniref:zinc ribbon domain-containing protein n=1 Tax=Nocardia sp. NPDC056611 TaxID=3345877 RepID=UPI00366F2F73
MAELLPSWRRGLVHVQYLQVRKLQAGKLALEWLGGAEAKELPSYLSARQWKSVVNQVNAALEQAWWCDRLVLDAKTGTEATPEALRKCRELIRAWLWRHPFPNLSRVRTMAMNGPIAQVEVGAGVHAEYWVRISTMTPGRPVRIPLHGYDYFNEAPGQVRNFCQVTVADDGGVSFALVKKSQSARVREKGASVGVDWGVASMFTTSSGQILGQRLHNWLLTRDRELTALAAALQRQGLKPGATRRYRALNARIRGYVRNEVGRLLNQIAAQEVREIVVENLDFRGGGLSKRMNRIVARAGRAAVTAKLASLKEAAGITVSEINPAYSSRACSGCNYVDARNRTSQRRFVCRFCGKKLLADINAARNVLGRSRVEGGWLMWPRDRVLAQLDREFTARWRCDPARLRERPTRRGRSTASPPRWSQPQPRNPASKDRILQVSSNEPDHHHISRS